MEQVWQMTKQSHKNITEIWKTGLTRANPDCNDFSMHLKPLYPHYVTRTKAYIKIQEKTITKIQTVGRRKSNHFLLCRVHDSLRSYCTY